MIGKMCRLITQPAIKVFAGHYWFGRVLRPDMWFNEEPRQLRFVERIDNSLHIALEVNQRAGEIGIQRALDTFFFGCLPRRVREPGAAGRRGREGWSVVRRTPDR